MKKQKIENIFSSMEDFSSVPPPELWGQIEAKLDKPKKKKRAILWWSAAACLLLGLLLPSILHFKALENKNFDLNNTNDGTPKVVLDDKTPHRNQQQIESTKKNETKQQTKNTNQEESVIVKEPLNNSSNSFNQQSSYVYSESDSKNNKDSQDLNSNVKNQTKSTLDKKESLIVKEPLNNSSNGFNQQSSYVYSEPDSKNKKGSQDLNSNAKIQKNNTTNSIQVIPDGNGTAKNHAVAESNVANAKNKKSAPEIPAEKAVFGKTKGFNSSAQSPFANAFEEQKVVSNATKNAKNNSINETTNFGTAKNNTGKPIFGNTNNTDNPYLALSPELNAGNKKASDPSKSSFKNETSASEKALAINQDTKNTSKFGEALMKQDSAQLAVLQNLEKGILTPEIPKDSENEKEDKKASKKEKWAVALYAGVANSENYKNNKTLGSTNDSKQTSAYGVKTSYKINKKWAVGSGLKINELGQSVANVSYMNAKNTAFFTSSDFYNAQLASADKITGNADFIFVPTNSQQLAASENIQNGNLDQNLRYIEMPLEVSYSIFNRNKASINLNTGGFVGKLISNTVTLDGQSLGQNINANDYVYGSTLSSTLQYRVYKKTNVFVEPAMNYYINPLNSQSFNQFQWGLNFGLNVSF